MTDEEHPQHREDLTDFWKRTGKKVLWGTMLRHELEAALETNPVVLVPIGSIEQHGPACPLDVDIADSYAVCLRAAQQIHAFDCLVAPPVSYGLTPYNMGWTGTITLSLETAVGLLRDVCASIHQHGFRKIILVNGHGGNVPLMGVAATKLSVEGIYVGTTSVWDLGQEVLDTLPEADRGSIGHAGDMETSIQLYLRPFLVDMARAEHDPNPQFEPTLRHPRMGLIELLRETRTGIMGDGTAATAEKGRVFVEAAAANLIEVANWFREKERVAYGYLGSGEEPG